jgi:hypothetical protein
MAHRRERAERSRVADEDVETTEALQDRRSDLVDERAIDEIAIRMTCAPSAA